MRNYWRAYARFFDLRTGIILLLGALVALTLAWAAATLWHVQRDGLLVERLAFQSTPGLSAAQEMRRVLAALRTEAFEQGPTAVHRLAELKGKFEYALASVRPVAGQGERREVLARIDAEWGRFTYAIDRLADPDPGGGERARREAHMLFARLDELCRAIAAELTREVEDAGAAWRERAGLVSVLAWTAISATVILSLLLIHLLFRHVLAPIRAIALQSGATDKALPLEDEITALGHRLADLAESVDTTSSELQESREHLMQTEKLALVGKLAAGVAHSIRNPLTSVKMRLFSLERSLVLTPQQHEDLEVISEEIRHLDTIIRNFLEFSRRPKLKFSAVSPSDVVDMTLELLRHRLESSGVGVGVERSRRLPEINGDPDQLKEALVNLILNACEAMTGGGRIAIAEETGYIEPVGDVAIVSLRDSGPGIPPNLRDKVFQPFFTTKGEGTGLGLPIAKRIFEEHGGWLHLKSGDGKGAGFVMVLPLKEKEGWRRS